MKTSSCPLRVAMLLPALLVLLAGCDDSNDGRSVRLFFGTNNIHACMPITVYVDLAAGDAVLDRQSDGSPDCALDAFLASSGCSGTFDDGGGTLQVSIDGCEIPEIAGLFECSFSDADVSALAMGTSAECDCVGEPQCHWNIFCFRRPGICVSQDSSPSACEDCFNGEDDDGNGFVDCDDENCLIADCGYGQSTITCSSTSTTTTTTTL